MTLTTSKDIEENELERQWAQVLNDRTQPKPEWYGDLCAEVKREYGIEFPVLALDIIERFPPHADNDQVTVVIESRLQEERLLPYSFLVGWLYEDKERTRNLDMAFRADERFTDLEQALRHAWEDWQRDMIATVRVFLCQFPEVQGFHIDLSDES